LLDGRRFFLHLDYSDTEMQRALLDKKKSVLKLPPPAHSLLKELLPYREDEFDPQNIIAFLNDKGILTIVIPLRSKAFDKGGTFGPSEEVVEGAETFTDDDFPITEMSIEEWRKSELEKK
jgi:hypothetical protein